MTTSRALSAAAITLPAVIFIAAGCGLSQSPSPNSGPTKPTVIATTPMIASLVQEVGGAHVRVETLFGSTVDPHTYQPVAADMRKLSAADAVFYNGLQLEGTLAKDFEKMATQRKHVVAVGDAIPPEQVRRSEDYGGYPDPHIWMDVELWASTVPLIESTLTRLVPSAESAFAANAKQLSKQLAALDAYVASAVASIPEGQRHLVTAHDAFGYFADAYGIEVSSVQGVSTESEAGLNDVRRLVDLVVMKRIPAVFFETSVSDRNVTAVIEGARAAGHEVVLGGELFSDSTGKAGSWEGTYFGMIDHNVNMITAGLGGVVPEKGFRGTLASAATTSDTMERQAAP